VSDRISKLDLDKPATEVEEAKMIEMSQVSSDLDSDSDLTVRNTLA
jgi:hypothetical protein